VTHGNVKPIDGSLERTSTSLLRDARGDDPTAWTRLVETYGRLIYRWCRRAGLQAADAADVTQETLRGVARGLREYRHGEPGQTFRGWLYRIAQNKIRDHHRRNQRNVAQPSGGPAADDWLWPTLDERSASATSTAQTLLRARVAEVAREFSPRNWQIYWRAVVDGQDTAELASEFGVSANVVRLVKSRVSKRLKELLCDQLAP